MASQQPNNQNNCSCEKQILKLKKELESLKKEVAILRRALKK